MNLPVHIQEWFASRGVTKIVLEDFNIGWDGKRIIFPIYSSKGTYLFSKFRRDPASEEGSKYTYEVGATAALYGAHKIINKKSVIVCEGEGDLLTLYSKGYIAVTGTGGAGTFKDEWLDLLKDKDIYLCFDDDDAGRKGMVKLLTKINAKLIVLPQDKDVKDITDFFKKYTLEDFKLLIAQAKTYPILSEPIPEFKHIKDIEAQKKKYNNFLSQLRDEETEAKNAGEPYLYIDHIKQLVSIALDNLRRAENILRYVHKPVQKEGTITKQDIIRAKEIPIETLYTGKLRRGNGINAGLCPFHKEKGPSFVIYSKTNSWFCFGACSRGGDIIEFIKRRDNCDFITAVKTLLNR